MEQSGEGSVTQWIGDLKSGDHEAADRLWRRYFDVLVRLAGQRLRRSAPVAGDEDGEDAALSAFHSLCEGAALGRFDQLSDRDDLWRLLVVITARKVLDLARKRRRLKRGGGRLVDEAALRGDDDKAGGLGLEGVVGAELTPEFAAMIAEEIRIRLDQLCDE